MVNDFETHSKFSIELRTDVNKASISFIMYVITISNPFQIKIPYYESEIARTSLLTVPFFILLIF